MDIGIGLPGEASPDDPTSFLDWARRAEDRGFSTLALVDRLVFSNYEPLVALAAAAAVTHRIRLTTAILIAPYRINTALLAKQIATLDRLSAGRAVIGIGIGARDDDYVASGVQPRGRAQRLEAQIAEMRRLWAGEARGYAGGVGPAPTHRSGPELLIAGHVPAALRRSGRLGDGWIMGGGSPDDFRGMAAQVHDSWASNGRVGKPRTAALGFFSLGPEASENAEAFLSRYYDFPPDEGDQALLEATGATNLAEVIIGETATSPAAVAALVDAWTAAGCDELIMLPCSNDLEQVDLLADALTDRLPVQSYADLPR